MSDLKERYGAFGASVVEQIQLELNRKGDLRELLTRLDSQLPDDLEQQHEELYKVIARFGPLFFMTVAKSDWDVEQVRRMKKNLKTGVDTPMPGSAKRLTPTSRRSVPGTPLGTSANRDVIEEKPVPPPPPARPVQRLHATDRPVVNMRSPYSAPAKGSNSSNPVPPVPQAGMAPTAPRAYIDVPTYRGPDRRLRGERRVGVPDRRAGLEVVYKNSRYGGKDRRKEVRRAEDRAKGGGRR